MLHQHTLDKLHQLRLTGMAAAFEQQLAQPASQELSFEERFALLLDQEILTGTTAGSRACSRPPSYASVPVWRISTTAIRAGSIGPS